MSVLKSRKGATVVKTKGRNKGAPQIVTGSSLTGRKLTVVDPATGKSSKIKSKHAKRKFV